MRNGLSYMGRMSARTQNTMMIHHIPTQRNVQKELLQACLTRDIMLLIAFRVAAVGTCVECMHGEQTLLQRVFSDSTRKSLHAYSMMTWRKRLKYDKMLRDQSQVSHYSKSHQVLLATCTSSEPVFASARHDCHNAKLS